MFKSYLKTALRSLWRSKGFCALNIFGLSVGIAASLLLLQYVRFESSFDNFYQDGDRIFRLYSDYSFNGRSGTSITGSGLMAPTLMDAIPEVELAGRSHIAGTQLLRVDDKKIYDSQLRYADPALLNILEYQFIIGSSSGLNDPNGLVLTESLASKLFGNSDHIIGKQIYVGETLMEVRGIVKDQPKNTHFIASGFISTSTLGAFSWSRVGHVTYVKLKDARDYDAFLSKMPQLIETYIKPTMPSDGDYQSTYGLYPIRDIYLSEEPGQHAAGNKKAVVTFWVVALFILLIAGINYVNLATARAVKRSKEIGMRKVIGAAKRQLVMLYLIESWIIAIISVLFGGFFAEIATGLFNNLTGKSLEISMLSNLSMLGTLLIGALIIGLLAGIYPALIISSFKPSQVINGQKSGGRSRSVLRKILVSFQFIISIGMMISTLVVYHQIQFLENKDLGYNEDNVYAISLKQADPEEVLKQELLKIPGIQSVAATNLLPATGDSGATFEITNEQGETSKIGVSMSSVDYDYMSTMEFRMLEGRNFSREISTDENAIIINESFAKKYGLNEPLGKTISLNEEGTEEKFHIIGVVEDFNMLSLYEQIVPFAFFLKPKFDWGGQYLFTKLSGQNLAETQKAIQGAFEKFESEYPLNAFFISDYFHRVYSQENKRGEIYLSFSLLTVLIACVGLFGLAAHSLEQRLKEISIRKVLGAKLVDIVHLISKEFILIIIISTLIASPLAYIFMEDWLSSFAYRDYPGPGIYLIAFAATATISLLTIGFHGIKTARTNPAETLRDQ